MFLEMKGLGLTARQNSAFSWALKMMSLAIDCGIQRRRKLLEAEMLSSLKIKPLKTLN